MNNYYDSPMLDPVILNEGDLDYYQTSLFFSDELFNGKTYVMRIKVTMGVTINNDEIKPIGAYYAELRSVSKNYYLYRKYYTRHTHNQQQQDKDFNDLVYMGEPINMYSNIENGYGVFAGYQSSVMQLKLKN